MKKLTDNYLLLASISFLVLYWTIAPLIPKPFIRNVISILSVVVGVGMIERYAVAFYRVLFKRERDGTGAYLAVFGATLAGIGVVFSGMFAILWIYFGMPPEWSATATSSFGMGLICIGVWLITISPDTPRPDSNYPPGFWLKIFWLFGLVAAFVAGAHFSSL